MPCLLRRYSLRTRPSLPGQADGPGKRKQALASDSEDERRSGSGGSEGDEGEDDEGEEGEGEEDEHEEPAQRTYKLRDRSRLIPMSQQQQAAAEDAARRER